MSGGGQSTNTVSSVPGWLQPYLTQSLTQGQNLLAQGGPQMEQQVAGLNSMQQAGANSIAQAATQPNANNAANTALQGILGGQNLSPTTNPYLAQTYQTALQGSQNQIASQFAGAGSNIVNSIPVQQNAAADLAGQIYEPAYAQGLQQQTQAAAYAPSVAQAQYLPGQALYGTGSALQGQTQNVLNAQSNMYNYMQALPYNTQSWYSSLVGQNANPFSQGSSSTTNNPNALAQDAGLGIGAASTAASLASLFSTAGPALASTDSPEILAAISAAIP